MKYIDRLINEIATEVAYKKAAQFNKRRYIFTGGLIGGLISLGFWLLIILEFYTLAPFT